MPLMRRFGVLVSALLMVGALISPLVFTTPARAASVTTNAPTELRSGPGAEFPVVATVPAGTALTIDGPPEMDYYPVTVNGQTGWLAGAALEIVKDVAGTETAAGAAPTAGAEIASNPAPSAAPVAAYDSQTGPTTQTQAQEVPADATGNVSAGEQASQAGGADNTVNGVPNDPPPSDPQTGPPPAATAGAGEAAPPADPAAGPPATDAATPAATEAPVAAPDPAAAPAPAPAASATPPPAQAVTGEATVPGGGSLFYEPDVNSGVVFWVPAGSTVWRIGEERSGFAKADYMAMVGWIAVDQLAAPVPVTAEVIPDDADWADDVRTPRPGSGVAFTAVDLTLRAGPSAAEAGLTEVPAGSRVVMTGVMENGFHRIDYAGTVGWVASDYLSTPPNPTPEDPATSRGSNETYSRDEIIAIINAAADRYGQDRRDMLRVAECESALDPYAVHPSGSYGLYQFIRSTWKSTPYGDRSMFNPEANANAAAWMWQQGRRSEWVCK